MIMKAAEGELQMIEHPNREQRVDLDRQKEALAKQEFEAALAAHEKRIDVLLRQHIESPTGAHVEYVLNGALPGIDVALANKYKDAGWRVTYVATFDAAASISAFLGTAPHSPCPPPRLHFS